MMGGLGEAGRCHSLFYVTALSIGRSACTGAPSRSGLQGLPDSPLPLPKFSVLTQTHTLTALTQVLTKGSQSCS